MGSVATSSLQGNGRTVQIVRRFRLLSQTQLAERVGKTQAWVANMEGGRVRLVGAELDAVAEALGVEVAALAGPVVKPAKAAS